MESTVNNEVRDAIRQLPIHERAVAIALKHIFDQVKALTRQQQQQIDANHFSFISRFKKLESQASDIIQGKILLVESDLDQSVPFFTPDEAEQKKKILKQKNKIEHFWFKAIQNSEYGAELTLQQENIMKAVVDIQTNITTNEIELILTIEKNNYVSEGIFHRKLVMDNGKAVSLEGDEPKWISSESKVDDGIFVTYILANSREEGQVSISFAILGNLVNQIVPYSLEYYLGTNDQEENESDEEYDEGEALEAEGKDK